MAKPNLVTELMFAGDIVPVKCAAATVFEHGQLVSFESSAGVHLDAATEDATFVGVVSQASPSDQDFVMVAVKGVIDIDVTSGTFDHAAGLKYAAGGSSTVYSLVADGGANTIMWAWETRTSAVTRLRAYFNVPALQKFFAVDA